MLQEAPILGYQDITLIRRDIERYWDEVDTQLIQVRSDLDQNPINLSPIRLVQRWSWDRKRRRLEYTAAQLDRAHRSIKSEKFNQTGHHLDKASSIINPSGVLLMVNTWSLGRVSPDAYTRLARSSKFRSHSQDLANHQEQLENPQETDKNQDLALAA